LFGAVLFGGSPHDSFSLALLRNLNAAAIRRTDFRWGATGQVETTVTVVVTTTLRRVLAVLLVVLAVLAILLVVLTVLLVVLKYSRDPSGFLRAGSCEGGGGQS
jgi:hypothetical protein